MRASLLLWPLLLAFPSGCSHHECSEEDPCSFGYACVAGQCQERRCATSAQCAMEQYCANGACQDGCAGDEDCYPGSACDVESNTCVSAPCEDQHQDCAFKEFCNAATGECYEASGYYCRECNAEEDCGGGDNHCTSSGYCGVDCQDSDDCPAGFDCMPFVDYNGNIQYYQCYTYCWLYDEFDGDGLGFSNAAGPSPRHNPNGLEPARECLEDLETR